MAFITAAKTALSAPSLFRLFQSLVGAPACHRRFIDGFVRPRAGDKLIDFGCGTGAALEHLPEGLAYVGVDISRDYIDAARSRFREKGTFLCADVAVVDLSPFAPFDLAIAFGVLHHLDDRSLLAMVQLARRIIRPGGHLVTIDPCRVPGQPRCARLLIEHDRGRYVRDAEGYRRLLASGGVVETEVRTDMLRIPSSMIVARLRVE